MPIQSGQVGRYGIKATPDILGPHKGIPWRSPALSNAMPTINGRTHSSTGAILASCTVWAMSTQSDTVMGTTTSDANGLFALTLYTSGSYYLVAYKTGASVSTTLPAQITLTRASSGTNFDSSGVLQTATSNVARFDYTYNGSTWVAAGLLVEGQQTNLVTTSDFTLWDKLATSSVTAVTGLDGTSSAYDIVPIPQVSGSGHLIYLLASSYTTGAGVSSCLSVYAKSTDFSYIAVRENSGSCAVFNIALGTVVGTFGQSGWTVSNTIITPVGGGWYRLSAAFTPSSPTSTLITFIPCDGWVSGDPYFTIIATDGIQKWTLTGPQAELSATAPSSVIFCTGTTTTRSADIVSSTDATLLAAKGWVVETGEMVASTDATLLGINTAIGIGATAANALTTADGGAQTTANTGTWTGTNRGGLAFDATPRVSIDLNGGTVVTAANSPVTPTNLYFGNTNNGASGFLNGHIRAIAAYSALTDGQLPTISTVGAAVTSLSPTFSVQWAGTSAPDVSGTTVNTLIPT